MKKCYKMEFKLNDMTAWERKKAIFLMEIAESLGIELDSSYGEVAVNQNSGYVYIWNEDYNFSLYMPIDCELKKTNIYALWTCSYCGEEIEYQLNEKDTLKDIEKETEGIEKDHFIENPKCEN